MRRHLVVDIWWECSAQRSPDLCVSLPRSLYLPPPAHMHTGSVRRRASCNRGTGSPISRFISFAVLVTQWTNAQRRRRTDRTRTTERDADVAIGVWLSRSHTVECHRVVNFFILFFVLFGFRSVPKSFLAAVCFTLFRLNSQIQKAALLIWTRNNFNRFASKVC